MLMTRMLLVVLVVLSLLTYHVNTSIVSGTSNKAWLPENNLKENFHNIVKGIRTISSKLSEAISLSIFSHKKSNLDDANEWEKIFFNNVDSHNEMAMNDLLKLYYSDSGWVHIASKNNVTVKRQFLNPGPYVSKADAQKSAKHACVKSIGVIDSPPNKVFELFQDISRVSEYNDHCKVMRDIHFFPRINPSKWTKISWASGPKYGPLKARDFCSIVHFTKFMNGTAIIMNRPAYHPSYPTSNKYVRATILLAGNIIQPLDNGRKTLLTQIAHVNPGGGADTTAIAWMINQLCAVGPPTFMKKLEKACRK